MIAMIQLSNVKKTFNLGRPNEFVALQGITLSIEANRITVFKGPSGSGKTTLLSLVGCMARPTSGRIHLLDREITSLPERFLTEIRRKTFGFIFQQYNLIQGVTALENVMVPAYPSGEKFSTMKKRAMDLLDIFNISSKADSQVERLSGGEMQRVAIARALMNNPQVVIADEPTAHLDIPLSKEFMEIMGRLKESSKTVLIASHDPVVSESPLVDCVWTLRDGKIDGEAG
jgi:putative ABC transport system ATP-binding protein